MVEVSEEPAGRIIVLKMSEDVAETLKAVMGNIVGPVVSSRRGLAVEVWAALEGIGIECGEDDHSGTITFR